MALAGGWTALVYTLVAYVGARFRDVIFADLRFFVPLYLFLATWLIHVAIAALTSSLDVTTGLTIAPADAALTAVAGGLGEALIARASR
jgi:cell shape-determining protein MreD